MGRPTKAQQAAKEAAEQAAKAAAEQAAVEQAENEVKVAEEPAAEEPATEEPATEEPATENTEKTCADCARGTREMYHGIDGVRCPLRPFLQRASQSACSDCE